MHRGEGGSVGILHVAGARRKDTTSNHEEQPFLRQSASSALYWRSAASGLLAKERSLQDSVPVSQSGKKGWIGRHEAIN